MKPDIDVVAQQFALRPPHSFFTSDLGSHAFEGVVFTAGLFVLHPPQGGLRASADAGRSVNQPCRALRTASSPVSLGLISMIRPEYVGDLLIEILGKPFSKPGAKDYKLWDGFLYEMRTAKPTRLVKVAVKDSGT